MPSHRWPNRILIVNTVPECLDNIACNDRAANPSHMSCIVFRRTDYVSVNARRKKSREIKNWCCESGCVRDGYRLCMFLYLIKSTEMGIWQATKEKAPLHKQIKSIRNNYYYLFIGSIGNGIESFPIVFVCLCVCLWSALLDIVLNTLDTHENKKARRNKNTEK